MRDPFDPLQTDKELAAFGCFVLGIGLIIFILTIPGCAGTHLPPIDASFWAGDSAKNGISRSQENRTLECKDPSFDNYTCLSYQDIQKIYDTMLECKEWPTLATHSQIKEFAKRNPEVIQNVLQRKEGLEPVQR